MLNRNLDLYDGTMVSRHRDGHCFLSPKQQKLIKVQLKVTKPRKHRYFRVSLLLSFDTYFRFCFVLWCLANILGRARDGLLLLSINQLDKRSRSDLTQGKQFAFHGISGIVHSQ